MGSIKDKISYLNGTKQKLKTIINYSISALPSGYTQVKYIQSDGTQYIDTDYTLTSEKEQCEIEFEYVDGFSSSCPFGSYDGTTQSITPYVGFNTTTLKIYAGSSNVNIVNNVSLNTKYKLNIYANNGNLTATVNGGVSQDSTYNGVLAKNKIYLFGQRYDTMTPDVQNLSKIKCYSFKLYDNNMLVRNLVPCYRNSDNEVGMYDLVNNIFYTNQGTGVFTYSQEKSISNNTPFRQYPEKLYNQYIEILKDKNTLIDNIVKKEIDSSNININDTIALPPYNITMTKKSRQNISSLPADYTEVEYIQSTGTQYIDTGISGELKWNVVCQYTDVETNKTQILLGRSADAAWWFGVLSQGNGSVYGFGTDNKSTVLYNELAEISVTSLNSGISGNINNTIIPSRSTASSLWIPNSYTLFTGVGTGANTYPSKCKVFSCKAYNLSGTLVRNFIPCYRNLDKKSGLYDLVYGVFYPNVGTGEFLLGEQKFIKRDIPKEYTQLDYIESTGTQYINTEYSNFDDSTNTYDITFSVSQFASSFGFYGAPLGTSSRRTSMLWSNASGVLKVSSGGTLSSSSQYTGSYNLGVKYEKIIYCNNSTSKYSVDGEGNYSYTGSSNNSNYIYIFNPDVGSSNNQVFIGKLYGFKLFGDTVLIRDFVPCLRKSDNKPGLYDMVYNKFYTNAGTGEFLYGYIQELPDDYTAVEYIESTGTQYLDLDFKANQNYGAEVEYAITSTASSDSARVFGTRNGTGGIGAFAFISSGNGAANSTIYFASHGNTYAPNTPYIDTNWHTLKDNIDNDKKVYWDGNLVLTGDNTEFTAAANCNVFRTYNSSGYAAIGKAKIRKIKIYNNCVLIHNYIPCFNSSGTIGLYDVIDGRFFTNKGSGTFSKGAVITNPNPKNAIELTTIKGLIPEGYTEVDYIESNGTQYIDTGLLTKRIKRVDMIVENTTNSTKVRYIGGTGPNNYFLIGNQDGKYVAQWGTAGNVYYWPTTTLVGKHSFTIDLKQEFVKMDDDNDISTASSNMDPIPNNVYLFCYNIEGTASRFASIKFYRCKISTKDGLIRDFIPCYRNNDNVVGLYDIVENKFYTNAGTGDFTYGTALGNVINVNLNNGKYSKDYLIPIGANEICEIDGYKDELIIDKLGHCYLNKSIGKKVFTEEDISTFTFVSSSQAPFKTTAIRTKNGSSSYYNKILAVSNYYKGITYNDNWTNKDYLIAYNTDGYIRFRNIDMNDTLDTFKTWVTNFTPTVYYVKTSDELIDLQYSIDLTLFGENNTSNIVNSKNAEMKVRYISTEYPE